jgi:carbonic anhydrase
MKLTIIFNIIIVASVDCFSYDENKSDGPSKWGSINKNCNGFRQSPINLKQSEAYNGDLDANPLRIEKINEKPIEVKAWNSGRSFSIQMKYADGRPARIIGGPLPCAYNINAIYFHWGENDNNGSEHAINGKRFSLEAQIEAYNPKYKKILTTKKLRKVDYNKTI